MVNHEKFLSPPVTARPSIERRGSGRSVLSRRLLRLRLLFLDPLFGLPLTTSIAFRYSSDNEASDYEGDCERAIACNLGRSSVDETLCCHEPVHNALLSRVERGNL